MDREILRLTTTQNLEDLQKEMRITGRHKMSDLERASRVGMEASSLLAGILQECAVQADGGELSSKD